MLELVLHGPGAPRTVGHPAPPRVEVRNAGDGDVWIAGVLDGSEHGLRYPRYTPAVVRVGGAGGNAVVAAPAPAEDPLVGPLRPDDLRRLAPGESFDPTTGPGCLPLLTFATFAPAAPGRYRYTLTLSTDADRPEQWLGGFSLPKGADRETLLALVARIPRTTVSATPAEVTFR
ncbi:hypothetical protein ACFV6E_37030 [Streptomyces sp. NPDC059785]|uniref:hypothetical protein n=1 Tax=unclassified Streptomyces TaxID=2593676 RepID=UPI003653213B